MLQKTLISNFNAFESNNALTFDKKTIANIFKDFFSHLAESLLIKLSNAPNKYNIESVFNIFQNLSVKKLSTWMILLKNIDISRAAGIEKLSGNFLKMEVRFLVKPLSKICNLSIISRTFRNACKDTKLKSIFKKGKKTDL